ncbi:MAG: hypothetical protein K2Y22_10360 [Candidatus Obscuribacterales bacterium]|nr:hypothetical protein [Candidatus Obscuribacterales bacterium]
MNSQFMRSLPEPVPPLDADVAVEVMGWSLQVGKGGGPYDAIEAWAKGNRVLVLFDGASMRWSPTGDPSSAFMVLLNIAQRNWDVSINFNRETCMWSVTIRDDEGSVSDEQSTSPEDLLSMIARVSLAAVRKNEGRTGPPA